MPDQSLPCPVGRSEHEAHDRAKVVGGDVESLKEELTYETRTRLDKHRIDGGCGTVYHPFKPHDLRGRSEGGLDEREGSFRILAWLGRVRWIVFQQGDGLGFPSRSVSSALGLDCGSAGWSSIKKWVFENGWNVGSRCSIWGPMRSTHH